MKTLPLLTPVTDPTPLFDFFRGNYAMELLTAAVIHFRVFSELEAGPLPLEAVRSRLGLQERPAIVLLTGLCAMGTLLRDEDATGGRYSLTPLAREHLLPGGPFYAGDHVTPAAETAGVRELVDRLKTNRPAASAGTAGSAALWTYRRGEASAMDEEEISRKLTMSLAGRARNVAPVLAERVPLAGAQVLLDVAGGTGLYSFAALRKNPSLRAMVWDRPEVLKVTAELAQLYGVAERVECRPGDMFTDAVPACDVLLLSNVLHDWDVPDCRRLVNRFASALRSGGKLIVHDVFLNDNLDGPLPAALYSATLFCVTEGRAYSGREYRQWLEDAGLQASQIIPTLVNCGAMVGTKP